MTARTDLDAGVADVVTTRAKRARVHWRNIAGQLSTSSPDEPEAELDYACCWSVLGVARLHYLMVTDEMTTKSGAGRWGISYYDERWH